MCGEMWQALRQACVEIQERADIAVLIVEGTGGNFCSGADIYEFDKEFADAESARGYLDVIEYALTNLCNIDRPTIAKVEGVAVGGGIAIALACDIRIACDSACIAIPPAKLGLLYGPVETRLLVETVGPANAKDLLFSGRSVTAEEALRLGLVNNVCRATDLPKVVEAQAREWAQLSSSSIRGAKKAVRAILDADYSNLRSLTLGAAVSADFREGRTAFREKRRPNFCEEA